MDGRIRKPLSWYKFLAACCVYLTGLCVALLAARPIPEGTGITPVTPSVVTVLALFGLIWITWGHVIWLDLRRAPYWRRWLSATCLIGTVLSLMIVGNMKMERGLPLDFVGGALGVFMVVGAAAAALSPLHWWFLPNLSKRAPWKAAP